MSLNDSVVGFPAEFEDLVRDALLNLHDPARLETHPLAKGAPGSSALGRGKWLYRLLLDGVAMLRPTTGMSTTSRSWRTYRILELRYIDGREVTDVIDQLAISRIQYYRDHHLALRAVASILWDKCHQSPSAGAEPTTASPDPSDVLALTRREAESLLHAEGAAGSPSFDPAEALHGVHRLLRPLCARHGVDLQIVHANTLPAVCGDSVALRQVLLSILSGMIVAVGGGTVSVVAEHQARTVELRMRGILSDPADSSADQVGLSIEECRPFIEAIGGRIDYTKGAGESKVAQVLLRLPVADQPSLLVVDNSADFIRLVEYYLESQGWRVVGTSNVRDAYALALQSPPQAILLDIVIPGHDGWELLGELKEHPATRMIPIVICSVLNEPEVAISLGAETYLQKPIDRVRLVETLMPFR